MGKNVIRKMLLEGLLAIVILAIPFFLLLVSTAVLPAIVSFWLSSIIVMRYLRKTNPVAITTKKFQTFEKFLYFQMINFAFAFALLLEMMLLCVIIIIIAFVVFWIKNKKAKNNKLVKWTKYTVLHLLNLAVLMFLINGLQGEIPMEIVFILPIITFINGMQAAFFIKLEQGFPRGAKKFIAMGIIIFMIVSTAWSMFPR